MTSDFDIPFEDAPKKKGLSSAIDRLEELSDSNTRREVVRADIEEGVPIKSDALARAIYKYSLGEKRVMESMISMLRPKSGSSSDVNRTWTLRADEYAAAFGITKTLAYRELKDSVDGLMTKVITIKREDGKKRPIVDKYSLMSKATYVAHSGEIQVRFNPSLVHDLMRLPQYTKYNLISVKDIKSVYAWRLYEILLSYKVKVTRKEIEAGEIDRLRGFADRTVEQWREMLGVPESYQYTMFYRTAVETAIRELEKKTSLKITVRKVKRGRKIDRLVLSFDEDEQLKLDV